MSGDRARAQMLTLELTKLVERLGYPSGTTAVLLVRVDGAVEVGSTTGHPAGADAVRALVVTVASEMVQGAPPTGSTRQRSDGSFEPFREYSRTKRDAS